MIEICVKGMYKFYYNKIYTQKSKKKKVPLEKENLKLNYFGVANGFRTHDPQNHNLML